MRLDRPNLRMSTSNVDIQILLFIYYTALTGKTLDERTNVAGTVQFYSVIQLLQKLLRQRQQASIQPTHLIYCQCVCMYAQLCSSAYNIAHFVTYTYIHTKSCTLSAELHLPPQHMG